MGWWQSPEVVRASREKKPARNCFTDAEVVEFVADHENLFGLISALVSDDECDFDHHGGCQAHCFLSLEPGEMCPNEEAKRLIKASS